MSARNVAIVAVLALVLAILAIVGQVWHALTDTPPAHTPEPSL